MTQFFWGKYTGFLCYQLILAAQEPPPPPRGGRGGLGESAWVAGWAAWS